MASADLNLVATPSAATDGICTRRPGGDYIFRQRFRPSDDHSGGSVSPASPARVRRPTAVNVVTAPVLAVPDDSTTCLSEGNGFHFPACHMLHVCGVQILLECPLDLSAMRVFSPISSLSAGKKPSRKSATSKLHDFRGGFAKRKKTSPGDAEQKEANGDDGVLDADDLIVGEPWYKTCPLHLWDVRMIDVVLISSASGMLGLPFLTRDKNFKGKVYVTDPTLRLGQLMMDELVEMHEEFVQCFGRLDSSMPRWMSLEVLETMPTKLRNIVMGKDFADLANWHPLYGAEDVKDCVNKVRTLKYGEEAYYDETITVRPLSSGMEIGASNWNIKGPNRNISYISGSLFGSGQAKDFDFHSIRGSESILFSDFSSLWYKNEALDVEDCISSSVPRAESTSGNEILHSLFDKDAASIEMDKLSFICFCAATSLQAAGSVLISIGRIGVLLQLIELLFSFLESSNLKVPLFIVSSMAEELLAYTNIIPEWLCNERQQKLYNGEALFGHVELMREKKIHVLPSVHSPDFLREWKEPCIVFTSHWNMRAGPSVHLLHRWHHNEHCLLIIEKAHDIETTLLPYKPIAMKVLQCSFLSGMESKNIKPLLLELHPKLVLYPGRLQFQISAEFPGTTRFMHYSEHKILKLPSLKENLEADLSTDLAFQLQPRKLSNEGLAVARVKGGLMVEEGRYSIMDVGEVAEPKGNHVLHWSSIDPKLLVASLQEKGVLCTVEEDDTGSDNACIMRVYEPHKALIQVSKNRTFVSSDDETFRNVIYAAIDSLLDSI